MPLNFSVNISFLECRQRYSACHAVFNVQIYLKCISAIHSKTFILDLTFNSWYFYILYITLIQVIYKCFYFIQEFHHVNIKITLPDKYRVIKPNLKKSDV